MREKLFALIFTFAIVFSAFADTFTVTSNADSGAGTIREAIAMANANGTAVNDLIQFNITDLSISGRTIAIATLLPDLTSNITIDGTTQPGNKIGVSDAKIRITNATGMATYQIFGIRNVQGISIFGIHFDKLNISGFDAATAIGIKSSSNIIIGAPGKGNYFTSLSKALGDYYVPSNEGYGLISNIAFKSNIVNLTEDGQSVNDLYTIAVWLTNVKDIEIGGELEAEGNFIDGYINNSIYIKTDSIAQLNLGYLKLINNKFGCNYTQTIGLMCGEILLKNSNYYGTDPSQILIKGNSYDFTWPQGIFSTDLKPFITLSGKKGFIDIKANRINMLTTSWFTLNPYVAFSIANCQNGIIGGPSIADINYIAGCSSAGIALGNNKNITITQNSMWCNSKGIAAWSDKVTIPKTKIFTLSDYNVAGTTLALGSVEVFLNKSNCLSCENGKTYLGSTLADAAGNWVFTSAVLLDGPTTATGTSLQGATGEFAHPEYNVDTIKTKLPTCHKANGFIHGANFIAGTKYYWLHYFNGKTDTLFTENIDNASEGSYKFVVEQGKYCSVNTSVNLFDNSPKVNSQDVQIVNPSCGAKNGKILNNSLRGSYNKVIWKDAANIIMGSSADLKNVGAGQYKLVILDTTSGCGDSTIFFTLTNQSGPSLNINNIQIKPSTCSKNNGSIIGITASNVIGTPFIQWVDSANNIIGNNYDLKNVLPGKYQIKFKDASSCDTITTQFFIIPDNGVIIIDTTNKIVTATSCSAITGSIKQIKVTGGDSYQWINIAGNTVAGNTADVADLPSGNYQLTVTSNYGCSKTAASIFVPQAAFSNIGVTASTLTNASCSKSNGEIKIISFDADSSLYIFHWVDSSSNQTIATGSAAYNLNAGTYLLFAKDKNGCEKMILTSYIKLNPMPTFNYSKVTLINDQCNTHTGSIGLVEANGLAGPTTYNWFNGSNSIVGNDIYLKNAAAGTYILKLTDAATCIVESTPFIIVNNDAALGAPLYENLIIPRNSSANLYVKNRQAGNYNLCANNTGTIILQQNDNGNFVANNIISDTSFYVKRIVGTCESPLVKVEIKVVDKSYFTIPTAFTPNGDGKNDGLPVKVIGYIELKTFKIFNRFGELIFETTKLNDRWDGTVKGSLQPTGAYIWMAEGKDIKGNIVKDKGTIILLR